MQEVLHGVGSGLLLRGRHQFRAAGADVHRAAIAERDHHREPLAPAAADTLEVPPGYHPARLPLTVPTAMPLHAITWHGTGEPAALPLGEQAAAQHLRYTLAGDLCVGGFLLNQDALPPFQSGSNAGRASATEGVEY